MNVRTKWLSLGVGLLTLWSAAAAAEEIIPAEQLVGTVWATQSPYTWTKIDRHGQVDVYPSEGNAIEFLEFNGGVFAIRIRWWNSAKNLHVVEHGVLVPAGENRFHYIEVEHPDTPDFPGISGHGFFWVVDRDAAELSQVGHLSDGTAAGFLIQYKRVEAAPAPEIPVTYPPQK